MRAGVPGPTPGGMDSILQALEGGVRMEASLRPMGERKWRREAATADTLFTPELVLSMEQWNEAQLGRHRVMEVPKFMVCCRERLMAQTKGGSFRRTEPEKAREEQGWRAAGVAFVRSANQVSVPGRLHA